MWSNTTLGFSWLPVGECTRGEHHSQSSLDALVGFGLVGAASAGICITLNVQKLVHNRNYDPVTGRQSIHFTRIPLWWAAVIANGLSELVNLAALGFAPATLVAPLGCLSVVFNAFTAVFWLREPFFKRDLLGLALISAGVSCIVMGQVGSPAPPITVPYLREVVASSSFYLYLASLAAFLALLVLWAQPRFARRFAWVYLAESAVFGSATTAAARAFASLCGPPLTGDWANATSREGWPFFWGSEI